MEYRSQGLEILRMLKYQRSSEQKEEYQNLGEDQNLRVGQSISGYQNLEVIGTSEVISYQDIRT